MSYFNARATLFSRIHYSSAEEGGEGRVRSANFKMFRALLRLCREYLLTSDFGESLVNIFYGSVVENFVYINIGQVDDA